MISLQITSTDSGVRLDRFLRKKLALMALSRIYGLIRTGNVRVGGKKVKQDYRLKEGDDVAINTAAAELVVPDMEPADHYTRIVRTEFFKRNFSVLYEDADLLACNKPAGLVVHSGTGHTRQDTLIDLATAYLYTKKQLTPGDEPVLVHRLDRDTSGVILIARNRQAVRRCHEAFRERDLEKQYVAICHNQPPRPEGVIELPLVRDRDSVGETVMRVKEGGDFSRSRYRVDLAEGGLSRVEIDLETGRTHQIRVHLSHIGAPILGDTRYGSAVLDKKIFSQRSGCGRRLYLHAKMISLRHPVNGRTLTIKAKPPGEFSAILSR